MEIRKSVIAGIVGTTGFTLFSYLMARAFNKKFEQPKLLGRLIDRTAPDVDKPTAQLSGWLLHYAIGIAFAKTYQLAIEQANLKPNLLNGLIAGAASGLPAVFAWHRMLKMHPLPPRKASPAYFAELVAGHLVFGAVTFLAFRMLAKREKTTNAIKRDSPVGTA